MTGLVVKRTSADVGDPARSVCSDDGETVFTFDAPELPASHWTDALGRAADSSALRAFAAYVDALADAFDALAKLNGKCNAHRVEYAPVRSEIDKLMSEAPV